MRLEDRADNNCAAAGLCVVVGWKSLMEVFFSKLIVAKTRYQDWPWHAYDIEILLRAWRKSYVSYAFNNRFPFKEVRRKSEPQEST